MTLNISFGTSHWYSDTIKDRKPNTQINPNESQQALADSEVQVRGYDSANYVGKSKSGQFVFNPVRGEQTYKSTAVAISPDGDSVNWCYNFDYMA